LYFAGKLIESPGLKHKLGTMTDEVHLLG